MGFRFAASLIDKTHKGWGRSARHKLHRACATELAALLRPLYSHADKARETLFKESVVVDDNGDAKFLAVVKKQFRGLRSDWRPGSPPLVGKVVFQNSASDEMLQLVDMVCGAVGAWVTSEDRTWYDLIAERDVEVRVRR